VRFRAVGAYCHPQLDAHQQDKEVNQMRKHLAIACFSGCGLFVVSAYAQTSTYNSTKLRALQTQYEELSARYQEKCKSTDNKTEIKLLHIDQGAGLSEGIIGPVIIELVDVVRSLQKQVTDGMCERATEYADLAQTIGDILEGDNAKSR